MEFNNTIYGLFFYTINTIEHMIIHCGTSLYDYNINTKEQKTIKSTGMNPRRSQSFIYNNILYYYRNLGKNKIILPKKNIRKVFETPSNYFDIEIGKKMIISEN